MKAMPAHSAGPALVTLGVLSLVAFLAAATFGYGTLAVIAGCVCVVSMASAMGVVGGLASDPDRTSGPRLLH